MKKLLNQANRNHRRNSSAEHREEFVKVRGANTKITRIKRKEYITVAQEELAKAKDMKTFWKRIFKYRAKPKKICPIGSGDWEKFYDKIYRTNPRLHSHFQDARHPTLDRDITYDEVMDALKRTAVGAWAFPNSCSL